MSRTEKIKDYELEITQIEIFAGYNSLHDGTRVHDGAIVISWIGNIGFGQYTLKKVDGKLVAESESMDKGEDKAFGKELLRLMLKQIEIVE